MQKRKLLISLIALIAGHISAMLTGTFAQPYANLGSKNDCGVYVESPHMSSWASQQLKKPAIKTNAYTQCPPYILTSVKMHVELWKKGWFLDHRVKEVITNPFTTSGARVDIKETFVLCKNRRLTSYFAKSKADAFINGQPWHAEAETKLSKAPEPCGT